MLRFLRPADPIRTVNANLNPIFYEDGAASTEFHSPSSDYAITHTIPSSSSIFNPPLHLHLYQTESFEVRKGQGTWYMPRHPNPALRKVLLSGNSPDPEARRADIPKREYHRYENALADEPLVVDVRLDKQDWAMEESFFRNFFGYLDDSRKAGTAPSVFQLMRFLWEFDCPLAVPCPGPNWLAVAVSKAVCGFVGVVIGEGLLGYKGSYVEYYNPKSNS